MLSKFEIYTARLALVKPEEADLERLKLLLMNPIMTMHREMAFDENEIRDIIYDSEIALSNSEPGLRLILDKKDQHLIGLGGVKRGIADNQNIYQAFMYLSPNEQGKGYGREALAALIQEAIRFKITTIHSFIGAANYPMQFLLESLGFIKQDVVTVNLDYNIVTRAHFLYEGESENDVLISPEVLYFPK